MSHRHATPVAVVAVVALLACNPGGDAGSATETTDTTGASTGAATDPATTMTPTSTSTTASTATTAGSDSGTTGTDTGDPTTQGSSGDASSSSGGVELEPFSFFVTSLRAMQELSGSELGFGGDLRFGEEGPGAGLRGADRICETIAETSMPGSAAKGWRAFLSAAAGEDGQPVHAIDRVGQGPWYDRLGRLVAMTPADLAHERPLGADPAIVDDLPNEEGVPNHQPDLLMPPVDNHDTLTGSNQMGRLAGPDATCSDWTSSVGQQGVRPRIGHMWPRNQDNGRHWISDHEAGGCAPGVNLFGMGGPQPGDFTVGAGGGYGAIYCFALSP